MLFDRLRGCLLGGAIGDALGMPFEEMPLNTRLKIYGNEKITDFKEGKPYKLRQERVKAGSVTDDTEMTLATIESILNNRAINLKDIANNLLKWLKGELSWMNGIVQNRNIGHTTRQALEYYARTEDLRYSGKPGAGCGASIRITPIAFCCHSDFELLKKCVFEVSRLTHRNNNKPLAEEGALCIASCIYYILSDRNCDELINFLIRLVSTKEYKEQLDKIHDCLKYNYNANEASTILGTGNSYLSHEVVGMAIFIFLSNINSFKETVISAVNLNSHAGVDTDSIASLAGSLSGCYLGAKEVPSKWKKSVEYNQLINSISKKLYDLIVSEKGRVRLII